MNAKIMYGLLVAHSDLFSAIQMCLKLTVWLINKIGERKIGIDGAWSDERHNRHTHKNFWVLFFSFLKNYV